MNSKNKSYKIPSSKKYQKPSKKFSSSNQTIHKLIPSKKNSMIIKSTKNKMQNNLINNKINPEKIKDQINDEDSSTNFLSGFNNKKTNINLKNNFNNLEKEEKYIPLLVSKKKQSKTESFFINFKLGEKDPFIENIFKNESKNDNKNSKKISLKNNYFYCQVNNDEKDENDSLELYDFNDNANVEFVLKNISFLNENKCQKSNISNIFENCNETSEDNDKGKEKIVNNIKIFEVNKNIFNLNSKT